MSVLSVCLSKVTFSYSLQGEGEKLFLAQGTITIKMLNALFTITIFLQNK